MMKGQKVLNAAGSFQIPQASVDESERVYFQITVGAATGVTLNFKKQIADAAAGMAIGYRKETDRTYAVANIAADAMVSVDAAGGVIEVDLLTITGGAVTIDWWRGEAGCE